MEADVCQFGHELIPGSDPVKLTEIDPDNGRILKQETKLLRRHLVDTGRSVFDPTGLGPAGCDHGLRVRRDGRLTEHEGPFLVVEEDGAQLAGRGSSWIRVKYLRLYAVHKTFMVHCPVCDGEAPPDDMIVPADGSFTPQPQDLPSWAS